MMTVVIKDPKHRDTVKLYKTKKGPRLSDP